MDKFRTAVHVCIFISLTSALPPPPPPPPAFLFLTLTNKFKLKKILVVVLLISQYLISLIYFLTERFVK